MGVRECAGGEEACGFRVSGSASFSISVHLRFHPLRACSVGSVLPWSILSGVRIRASVFFWRAEEKHSGALDIQGDIWYTVLEGGDGRPGSRSLPLWRGRRRRGEWRMLSV